MGSERDSYRVVRYHIRTNPLLPLSALYNHVEGATFMRQTDQTMSKGQTGDRISCGCCPGPVEDRCCCWNHMDIPRGLPPKTCSRHRHLATETQPYRAPKPSPSEQAGRQLGDALAQAVTGIQQTMPGSPARAQVKAQLARTIDQRRLSHILALEWQDADTGHTITFVTTDADWHGERWNGYPAPRLPKWQAYLLSWLMGENDPIAPRADVDEDATQESAYVHMDGLTWIEPCHDCGMPHTSQHECEPRP